ncbi:MAG: sugar diacid utilization regulator, partial [Jatrophihabitans sp.]
LVYRLARLESLTGHDMRDFTAVIKLYLACLALRLGEDHGD